MRPHSLGCMMGVALVCFVGVGAADDALPALGPAALAPPASQASDEAAREESAVESPTAARSIGNVNFVASPTTTPAIVYAKMDRSTCEAELAKRAITYTRLTDARGVLAPERLTSRLHGVSFHSALPAAQRPTSPYEIIDCRLILALDDLAVILARYDVVEVVHMSVYRPPYARTWAAGRIGKQHDGALAMDAGSFVKRDGTSLQVERDFHGAIGAPTCGAGTGPNLPTAEALLLRKIACEAATAHLFNVELTPDYNWQHRNHFHLEVTPNVTWFLVH